MLSFFSSSSRTVNPKRAMAECLEKAMGSDAPDCALIVLHTTMGHNFGELLAEARKLCPKARIAGCTGSGVIGKEGPNESMRALAIMAISGPENEFAVAGIDSLEGMDPFEAGARIGRDLKSKNSRVDAIYLMSTIVDIFPADGIIDGIESVFGPHIPICGGFAFDNMNFVDDFQFMDDRVLERGAVAVGFADPTIEFITGANHGFQVIDDSFEVTRSDSNRIYELNGLPAWKALLESVGLQETADPQKEIGLTILARRLPEKFHDAYGSPYISCSGLLKSLHEDDGSIQCSTNFSEGMKIWLTKRDETKIYNGVDRLTGQINKQAEDRIPLAVFHADCAARGKYQFHHIVKRELIKRIQEPLCKGEDVPWLGFYAASECCMVGGKNMVHGFTTSLSAAYRRA
jgi:hypothetical protein